MQGLRLPWAEAEALPTVSSSSVAGGRQPHSPHLLINSDRYLPRTQRTLQLILMPNLCTPSLIILRLPLRTFHSSALSQNLCTWLQLLPGLVWGTTGNTMLAYLNSRVMAQGPQGQCMEMLMAVRVSGAEPPHRVLRRPCLMLACCHLDFSSSLTRMLLQMLLQGSSRCAPSRISTLFAWSQILTCKISRFLLNSSHCSYVITMVASAVAQHPSADSEW